MRALNKILGHLAFASKHTQNSKFKPNPLGAITPLGRLAFLAGWICLALAAWRGQ
jgi:uncharacterized membrane protein YgdD (TMEM256/DUF423 family)